MVLFGLFGISEIFALHHRFGTTATSRIGYLVLTAIFLSLAVKLRCAIERIVLMILAAIFAVALSASVLGPGAFFSAKVAIMCGWFLAGAACGFWAFYSSRHAAGSI
jgi:sorbitol-specific phosphotransferase system component IIBC